MHGLLLQKVVSEPSYVSEGALRFRRISSAVSWMRLPFFGAAMYAGNGARASLLPWWEPERENGQPG
jgi:hypothetical protein